MDEVCPACSTVHQGFEPRAGQHHSFWRCRRCNVDLFTIKVGDAWEVHGEALAVSLCPDIIWLRERHDMLRSFGSFIYHPVLSGISTATENADTRRAFYDILDTLHKEHSCLNSSKPRTGTPTSPPPMENPSIPS